jgi:hypothetical protein
MTVPQQDNGCDCGVFVCRYAISMIEIWRQHKITFGNRETVITDSVEFSFDMGNIARLRREMKVLIQGLSKLHHPLAENKRRLELAASKLKASKKKSTLAPPSTASSDDTPLASVTGAPPSGAPSGGQPSTDVAAGVMAEADSTPPLTPPIQPPPDCVYVPPQQPFSSDVSATVISPPTNCGSLDPTFRRARLSQAFDRLAALYFPQRRLAVAYLPHTLLSPPLPSTVTSSGSYRSKPLSANKTRPYCPYRPIIAISFKLRLTLISIIFPNFATSSPDCH